MALLSFSQRVGYRGMCVIPTEALSPKAVDDDPLSLRFVSCATVWRALIKVGRTKLKEAASTGISGMGFWLQLGWLQAVPDMIWVVLHRRRQYLGLCISSVLCRVRRWVAYGAWPSHLAASDRLIPEKMEEGDGGCQADEHPLCVLPSRTSLVIHPSSTAVISSHRRR